jgi:hypothetical protein
VTSVFLFLSSDPPHRTVHISTILFSPLSNTSDFQLKHCGYMVVRARKMQVLFWVLFCLLLILHFFIWLLAMNMFCMLQLELSFAPLLVEIFTLILRQ